ncbi:hypothetical protein [Gordonia malaquae]|uniref:hypothetical protein n=1 Tax=Gordonia malaquae TaxID=410332 RepID=UPI0030FF23E5
MTTSASSVREDAPTVRHYSPAQLASRADAPSIYTIKRAIKSDQLPAFFVGRELRVYGPDFEKWLASRVRPANRAAKELTPEVRAWAEEVAATAPDLTPAQAAAAARLIVGGASA